jgi:CubicO group peptidase (beta-lactamase class C family)
MVDLRLHGYSDDRFDAVRLAFRDNLVSGEELGASLFVDVDGHHAVDLWGGFRDSAQRVPWDEHTITNVWSVTKMVSNFAALMLIDRGQLAVRAPVAAYWPEFAANGKASVEVRHIMSHSSGVAGLDQPAAITDLYDHEPAVSRMAAQAPWWSPGTRSGYHLLSQGHLIGELIRRVTGRSLRQFVAEEIAGPLGADFQIGADAKDWGRIADVVPPPPLDMDLEALDHESPAYKAFTGPAVAAEDANTPAWRMAGIGAANGHGNARSVAQCLSAISRGGAVDGVRLLSPETIDLIFEEQTNGIDIVNGLHLRWGMGFALPHADTLSWIPDGRICFWGGWGGSITIMDLERRLTISYVMNKMAPGVLGSERSQRYVEAIYKAVS